MSFFSPLRYPGGKNRVAGFIDQLCTINNINGHYIEPYAGGASVALHLLLTDRVREITINDLDRALYAFWLSVVTSTDELCNLIDKTPITPEEWLKQKNILLAKQTEPDIVKLGFATLFLNKTNYSGVLRGGMIGGKAQTGTYKIDCRFNKSETIRKIRAIAEQKDRIHVTNFDAVDLIKHVPYTENSIFYFDPPYYNKGPYLYMNHYNTDDHAAVSEAIKAISGAKWVVSYDDTEEIHKLYDGLRFINYSFAHTAGRSRQGKEVVFFSDSLVVDTNIHPVTLASFA